MLPLLLALLCFLLSLMLLGAGKAAAARPYHLFKILIIFNTVFLALSMCAAQETSESGYGRVLTLALAIVVTQQAAHVDLHMFIWLRGHRELGF